MLKIIVRRMVINLFPWPMQDRERRKQLRKFAAKKI